MEAVIVGDGKIGFRASILRSFGSLLTISSGGSIGREGSMVQLSAMLGSRLGLFARAPIPRLRLMVACGAAAGIAAAYNAPISGALFVSEIVLGSIAMESFGPLVVSSVVSNATIHRFLGYGPVFDVPPRGVVILQRGADLLRDPGHPARAPRAALPGAARLREIAVRPPEAAALLAIGPRRSDRRGHLHLRPAGLGQRLQRRQPHPSGPGAPLCCWQSCSQRWSRRRRRWAQEESAVSSRPHSSSARPWAGWSAECCMA